MDTNQLTAWVAGCFEATGVIIVSSSIGPTDKPYATIGVEVILPPGNESAGKRFLKVANNGTVNGSAWHLGGYAAVRGFLATIWPYLTPRSKHHYNEEIKRFKIKKAELQ